MPSPDPSLGSIRAPITAGVRGDRRVSPGDDEDRASAVQPVWTAPCPVANEAKPREDDAKDDAPLPTITPYPVFRPTSARTAASIVPRSFGSTVNFSSRSNKSAIRGGNAGRCPVARSIASGNFAGWVKIMVLISFFGLTGSKNDSDPATWSNKKIDNWFAKKEWSGGWTVTPDASINKREFAVYYFRNTARWEKAFKFLKNNDLAKLELKRYDIDGDDLFATVSEYMSKNEETTKFEAHRKYIDIQYVISGKEIMNIAPLKPVKCFNACFSVFGFLY